MTHGQWTWDWLWERGKLGEGGQKGKKWENYSRMNNKKKRIEVPDQHSARFQPSSTGASGHTGLDWEDGSEIGGSRVHFPLAPVKCLADLRNRANSQQYSSIYEDQRPKIVEDIEKSDGETMKPGALKRPELDPNRGHPSNWDRESNFTLLLQRTCKVEVVNTSTLSGRGNHQQRNHQQITMEEGERGSGSHTNLNPGLIWKYN